MMSQNLKWLPCLISPGQFSDEFAVSGRDFQGNGFSLFAPEDSLSFTEEPATHPVEGYIRVEVVQGNDALRLVRLPARTMENGDLVTVAKERLSSTPPRTPVLR